MKKKKNQRSIFVICFWDFLSLFLLSHFWSHFLPHVFTLPQPGCVTTSSCAAKMAESVSKTSAVNVPPPTRACSVRSHAVKRSWVAAEAPIRAMSRWCPRHSPCCCCCCWAPHCWEKSPAGPIISKETPDLVGVINSPTAYTLTFPFLI